MMTTMRFCANGDEDGVLLSPRCDDDHLTKMRFSAWKPPHNTLFLNPLISTHIEEIFTPPKKYFCFSRSTCWLVGWCATSVNWARRTSQLMRSETLITRGDHSNRPDGHIWTETETETEAVYCRQIMEMKKGQLVKRVDTKRQRRC